jgi:hypothetical protein
MHLQDISKEYAVANRIIAALIVIFLLLPFASIISERLGHQSNLFYNPNCFVQKQTGKPCPTCGLTRSIILLYKGYFQESLAQYAYGYLFVLFLIAQLFLRAIPFLSNRVWIPYMDMTQMILCGMLWLFIIH